MQTKIDPSFWDDERVGSLAEKGDHEAILALLWLMTARVDIAGWVEFSPRLFTYHTSLTPEAIQRACHALGMGIVTHEKGFWLRHYIRYQLGTGESMAANRIAASIIKSFRHTPPEIVSAVLSQYPELQKRYDEANAPQPTSTSKGIPRGCQGEGEGEGKGEGGKGAGKGGPLTLKQALDHARHYCKSTPTMLAYDPVLVQLWFADRERKQWQASNGQVIGTTELAKRDLEFWLLNHRHGSPPGSERGNGKSSQKKNGDGPAGGEGNPLAAPPCSHWKELARAIAQREGQEDMTWLDTANWTDLESEERQAVVDEYRATRNEGRAA